MTEASIWYLSVARVQVGRYVPGAVILDCRLACHPGSHSGGAINTFVPRTDVLSSTLSSYIKRVTFFYAIVNLKSWEWYR